MNYTKNISYGEYLRIFAFHIKLINFSFVRDNGYSFKCFKYMWE